MNILLNLFLTFAKIGLFTFGGGYAMISLIENACVEEKHWVTHDDMMNITVIAESTPGPIAINCATFVGYQQKGITGAAIATFGMVFPSFCIIFLISKFLDHFLEIMWIAHAFQGIKCAVGILILDAAIKMISKMQKKIMPRVIMLGTFAAILAFWGIADDSIESENIRNIIKVGKRVERLDLYARLRRPAGEVSREAHRLAGRIPRTELHYAPAQLQALVATAEAPEPDYALLLRQVEALLEGQI